MMFGTACIMVQSSYSAGCGARAGPAFGFFTLLNFVNRRFAPSTNPPGRKTTISTNIRPSVRCHPSPTHLDEIVTITDCRQSGRKEKKLLSMLVLIAEKMFSKYLIRHAPMIGPNKVPTPPRIVISTTLPDSVHLMRSVPASGSVTESSAPARPAIMPETTNAASVYGLGLKPVYIIRV